MSKIPKKYNTRTKRVKIFVAALVTSGKYTKEQAKKIARRMIK